MRRRVIIINVIVGLHHIILNEITWYFNKMCIINAYTLIKIGNLNKDMGV